VKQYVTLEGHQKLTKEMAYLWKEKRPEIVRAITAAAAEGDRSENAEYIYRKKELRETDRRIRFLEKHLKDITVVRDKPPVTDKVFFGAWVDLEVLEVEAPAKLPELRSEFASLPDAKEGDEVTYRIVGSIETELHPKGISMQAPLARALLGKALEDEVEIHLPSGFKLLFFINAIRYT
jgi:transcription elongation factor GreB